MFEFDRHTKEVEDETIPQIISQDNNYFRIDLWIMAVVENSFEMGHNRRKFNICYRSQSRI